MDGQEGPMGKAILGMYSKDFAYNSRLEISAIVGLVENDAIPKVS